MAERPYPFQHLHGLKRVISDHKIADRRAPAMEQHIFAGLQRRQHAPARDAKPPPTTKEPSSNFVDGGSFTHQNSDLAFEVKDQGDQEAVYQGMSRPFVAQNMLWIASIWVISS